MVPSRAALLRHFTRGRWSSQLCPAQRTMSSNPGPSGRLQGKVALVTASTEGIGFAAARGLAQQGALVVLSSRRKDNVERAVAELRSQNLNVAGTTCHVGKREDRERLVATTVRDHGGIDILVSNAAVNPFFGNIMDSTEEVWDKHRKALILDVNVKATILLAKLVVPQHGGKGHGSIVIISSIAGYQPFQALGPYSVSKTALLGLTKALAPELAHMNIRVNCVAPGLIKTKFICGESVFLSLGLVRYLHRFFPFPRIGTPEDISGTVSFLCSEDASYITGETIVVAGGMNARL
ncbi:LOW QUALITY PROTEIN: dehydrogenase/reductase SDR family member 4 [Polyodon spathula]|uniref:LOW QUALITY PROTEIN: dehydrogenase/reductase SDR family member 4 n=1 Tax=Polyodon spathula TaxID=7913 RepID=UPI001B7EFA2C|nr:LOW QUALITY PROTEIN: dehydrogenase/reductase SDR family member 4 [Polyodon spathula]